MTIPRRSDRDRQAPVGCGSGSSRTAGPAGCEPDSVGATLEPGRHDADCASLPPRLATRNPRFARFDGAACRPGDATLPSGAPGFQSGPDATANLPRSGLSVIELLLVGVLLTLIVAPVLSLFISSQKTASSGYDNLEMLGRARQLMERVQRDLKGLCSADGYGFLPTASTSVAYTFPIFPTVPAGRVFTDEVPLDLVTYVFDPVAQTVTRRVRHHSLVAAAGDRERQQRVAAGVASFTIIPRKMMGVRYYDIELACVTTQARRDVPPVILRAAVRAEYELRLQRHPSLIPNRKPRFVFP